MLTRWTTSILLVAEFADDDLEPLPASLKNIVDQDTLQWIFVGGADAPPFVVISPGNLTERSLLTTTTTPLWHRAVGRNR